MARYKTIHYTTVEHCPICERMISNCAFGRTSHMRAHVRRNEAVEIPDYPRARFEKVAPHKEGSKA